MAGTVNHCMDINSIPLFIWNIAPNVGFSSWELRPIRPEHLAVSDWEGCPSKTDLSNIPAPNYRNLTQHENTPYDTFATFWYEKRDGWQVAHPQSTVPTPRLLFFIGVLVAHPKPAKYFQPQTPIPLHRDLNCLSSLACSTSASSLSRSAASARAVRAAIIAVAPRCASSR